MNKTIYQTVVKVPAIRGKNLHGEIPYLTYIVEAKDILNKLSSFPM